MQYPELDDTLTEYITHDISIFANPGKIAKILKDGIYKVNNQKIINLLITKDVYFLHRVLYFLGFSPSGLDYENSLTLISWYLYYDVKIIIDLKDRYFLSTASNIEILSSLPKEYCGTKNRASLIFYYYTGFLAPELVDYTESQRYQQVLASTNLLELYTFFYDINSTKGPVRSICSQIPSSLENIIFLDDETLIDWCIRFEVIPFKYLTLSDQINLQEVYDTLDPKEWETFKTDLYPQLKAYSQITIFGDIEPTQDPEKYSDLILIKHYKPPNLRNRAELLNLIKFEESHFRLFETFYYQINTGSHLLELEPRNNVSTNPIIAYGTLRNYKFYNLDEIIWSFEKDPLNFRLPEMQILRDSQICALANFLPNKTLLELIEVKKLRTRGFANLLDLLYQKYQKSQQKSQILQKLLELFYLGLYSRYWKGKDTDFPYLWKDIDNEDYTERETYCNLYLQNFLYLKSNEILAYIESIPHLKWDWQQKAVEYGQEKIIEICKSVLKNEFCLSHFSNMALQTSYYIITETLKLNLNDILQKDGCQFIFYPEKIQNSYHKDPTLKLSQYTKF